MTPDELIEHYPVLHHMAEDGAWTKIRQIGLRTTQQLVDDCDPDPATRAAILRERRSRSFELVHPLVGPTTIRDQKPLLLRNLRLSDVDLAGFLDILNGRVFLWAHPRRLDRLLDARSYRDRRHDVLVLDTASIVETCSDRIRLTGMNTGASLFPNASPRGAESFMTIADFPFAARRKPLADNVVELCVIGGIDRVEDHLIRVEQRQGASVVTTL